MKSSKLKREAFLLSRLAIVALVAFAVNLAAYLIPALADGQMSLPQFLLSLPMSILVVLTVGHAVAMLRSIARNESPFTEKNVKHLQWIGWMLVAFEPIAFLIQWIQNRFFPIRLSDGIFMTSTNSYGNIFLVCGFAVLAVATVFRYGMELQQLSDETL